MNILSFVIFVALFVAVTPGVLVTIPKGKNKHIVALVHGLFFGVAWVIVWNLLRIANLTHENLFFEGYVSRPYNNNFQKEYEKAIAEQNKIEKQQREKYERERPERERLAKIQAEKDAAELKKKKADEHKELLHQQKLEKDIQFRENKRKHNAPPSHR